MNNVDFTAENVKKLIGSDCNVILLDEVDSTNTYAKALAENGAGEWTVVLSKKQTDGRGRNGHSFFSPFDTGLYMSVILKPVIALLDTLLITTSAAVSVAEAIEKVTGETAKIKWVNDIYVKEKKVSGILTEASLNSETVKTDWVVLGIGINVCTPESGFPDDIKSIAGGVLQEKKDIRASLAAETVKSFARYYRQLEKKTFFDEYRRRMFLIGKDIDVIRQDGTTEARAIDIDRDFGLIVRYGDGRIETLSSGEVSAKQKKQ